MLGYICYIYVRITKYDQSHNDQMLPVELHQLKVIIALLKKRYNKTIV